TPASGIPVTFTVISGNGTLTGGVLQSIINTDAQGLAMTTLTLGPAVAINTVQATSPGVVGIPITFSATGIGAISLTSGDNQVGIAGTPLANSFVVTVTGAAGVPISNMPVTFQITAGGGSLDVMTVNTNSQGQAS